MCLIFFHLIQFSFEININIRKLNIEDKKKYKTKMIIDSFVILFIYNNNY